MTTVSPEMHAIICEKLAQIALEEDVLILLAVESGSRAWGFHPHDSDYDVRFIYARPTSWHLRLDTRRDVIERPISDELDISGWEVGKALKLAISSNAVLPEWLQSPIRYIDLPSARESMTGFCQQVLTRRPVMWHYLHLATKQQDGLRTPTGEIKLKRYLYTIRPVLALRYMRLHDCAWAPMNMAKLIQGTDLPKAVTHYIDQMIADKLDAGELGVAATTNPDMDLIIDQELALTREYLATATEISGRTLWDQANQLNAEFSRLAGQ